MRIEGRESKADEGERDHGMEDDKEKETNRGEMMKAKEKRT